MGLIPPAPPPFRFPENTVIGGPYVPQPRGSRGGFMQREALDILEEMIAICDAALLFDPLYHPDRCRFGYPPLMIGICTVPTGNPGTR